MKDNRYIICKLDPSNSRKWVGLAQFKCFKESMDFLKYKVFKDCGITIDKIIAIDKFCYKHKDIEYYILQTNSRNAEFFDRIF